MHLTLRPGQISVWEGVFVTLYLPSTRLDQAPGAQGVVGTGKEGAQRGLLRQALSGSC